MELHSALRPVLKNGRNLLAFSGGADSSALFHLLCSQNIQCDLALVNYSLREDADKEQAHAQTLAKRFNIKCHTLKVKLENANFEQNARSVRYRFFESLAQTHGYTTLLTAHHLGDRLEWLLMQLCKGSGFYELLSMQTIEEREHFVILRPLLHTSRKEIMDYLSQHAICWFQDVTNQDTAYLRNRFRHQFSNPLLEQFEEGIKKSFTYFEEDINSFYTLPPVHTVAALHYFKTPNKRRITLLTIDRTLKQCGYLMSQYEKVQLKSQNHTVLGRKYAVAINQHFTLIAPYENTPMDKSFKEQCRVLKIAPQVRPYLYSHYDSVFVALSSSLRSFLSTRV